MTDDTLTIDKLRHAAYELCGIKWRVRPAMPDGMILILSGDSVAVSLDIDKAVSYSFDLVKALEQLESERKVTVIDLRRVT